MFLKYKIESASECVEFSFISDGQQFTKCGIPYEIHYLANFMFYSLSSAKFETFAMSLTYIRNKSGPNIEH